MLLRTIHLGARRQSRRLGVPSWAAAAYYPEVARRFDDFATAGELGRQVLVLRALIEDFGGEATAESLCGRMMPSKPAKVWNEAQTGTEIHSQIRAVLAQLGKRGALALEDLGGAEVIARITRDGAIMAYGQPSGPAGPASV